MAAQIFKKLNSTFLTRRSAPILRRSLLLSLLIWAASSSSVLAQAAVSSTNAWREHTPSVLADLNEWMQEVKQNTKIIGNEKDLRLEWISLLQTRLEVHRAFTSENLLQAIRALAEDEAEAHRRLQSRVLPFAQNLQRVMSEVREPTESPFEVMKSYLEFAGIENPAKVEDFAEARAYINGTTVMSAQSVSREDVASAMEEDSPLPPSLLEDEGLSESELSEPLPAQLPTVSRALDSAKGKTGVGAQEIVPGQHSTLNL